MTTSARTLAQPSLARLNAGWLAALLTGLAFVLLFARPAQLLVHDWWRLPEAGHGMLLAPVAIYMAWRRGIRADATSNHLLGILVLAGAVALRYASELAAELFTMRASMLGALLGLTIYFYGVRQVVHWWLPFLLGALTIPLPELVTQAVALPLQFQASRMGAALLEVRGIPVRLTGNVIRMPGQELFVAEACSGLRSLTALVSVGVLLGAVALRTAWGRVALVAATLPVAILINGIRVFLTGFLVYLVSPAAGTGFMHLTEGWLLFLVSLTVIAGTTMLIGVAERRLLRRHAAHG